MQFKWVESAGEGIGKFLLHENAKGERTLYAGIFPWHKNLFNALTISDTELIAAGDFNKNFEVTKWFSEGFGVVTPHELRDLISATLRAHKNMLG